MTVLKGGYFIDVRGLYLSVWRTLYAVCIHRMICHGANGIAGVVVVVVMMIWY